MNKNIEILKYKRQISSNKPFCGNDKHYLQLWGHLEAIIVTIIQLLKDHKSYEFNRKFTLESDLTPR